MKKIPIISRFHKDKEANLLVIGAIFVMVLVIVLTVVINLAHITHEKIQAQNAADAAALSAGVWQVRGLSFVQSMNNLVYISDMLANVGLNMGVLGAYASTTVGGQIVGNAGLLVCLGAHGFSQLVLVPLRDIMNSAWPFVSALGGSEMAKRNEGRKIIASFSDMISGLGSETALRWTGLLNVGEKTLEGSPLADAGGWLWSMIEGLDIYALGFEMQFNPEFFENGIGIDSIKSLITGSAKETGKEAGNLADENNSESAGSEASSPGQIALAGLHLERVTEDWRGWPLVIADSIIDGQLNFCSGAMLPLAGVTKIYFDVVAAPTQKFLDGKFATKERNPPDSEEQNAIEGIAGRAVTVAGGVSGCTKWKHPYYTSSDEVRTDDKENHPESPDDHELVDLPVSTWFAGGGVEDDVYKSRTAIWNNMLGGLGVPQGRGTYGQLGSLACASIQVRADAVEKNPKTIRGWVNLVPVAVVAGTNDSRSIGICH